ncbi:hypothetical protein FM125_00870 [Micrococcus lylae]|uniref:Uncharacterized protein n=1 Tax=Micrococcus lylae TaxID=1273 RepID=A0A1R4I952_9MICC|nr:hypothetical protein FM125_00870 [Micrococcus lylae]
MFHGPSSVLRRCASGRDATDPVTTASEVSPSVRASIPSATRAAEPMFSIAASALPPRVDGILAGRFHARRSTFT